MRLGATGALGMWGLEKYGVQAIRRSGPCQDEAQGGEQSIVS